MKPARSTPRTVRPRPRGPKSRVPSPSRPEASPSRPEASLSARALMPSREQDIPNARALTRVEIRQLFAIAEIGYHYLRNGRHRAAEALFEGLVTLEPHQGYFWLALGLTRDHLRDKRAAEHHYRQAVRCRPGDPVPLVNLAELALERGDRPRVRRLLARARRSARIREDARMAEKVAALWRLSA